MERAESKAANCEPGVTGTDDEYINGAGQRITR